MNNLYLLFPQWQGSGLSQELYEGAKLLQHDLSNFTFTEVDVSLSNNLETEKQILGYPFIKQQLNSAINTIEKHNPEKIFTIGGDCAVELAPVSYLNKKYDEKLGVVWFDAHGDLNTPSSSPSKEFHGMPLRTLLNEGDQAMKEMLSSKLSPKQIFLAGIRDLDDPEKIYIKDNNVSVFNVEDLLKEDISLIESIRAKGFEKIYIHIDLDVLEPNEFPSVKCPTAQGLPTENLLELIRRLKNIFSVVGASVVEFSPKEDKDTKQVRTVIEELFDKQQNDYNF
jgi:arginase